MNYTETDLQKCTKTELLLKCEEYGLSRCKSKNKGQLIQLIQDHLSNKEPVLQNTPPPNDLPRENKLYLGHNMDVLKTMANESIDLVVTSPPYDDLRTYKGNYKMDLTELGKEIYRVLKDGGIYAMVIQDQTKDFAKSLTSFRTVISHCDIVGFRLFETCIYKKQGCEGAWWNKRFRVDHEYIHIFLKGKKPQYFNKDPIKIPSKHGGKTMTGCATRKKDGTTFESKEVLINVTKCPGTIWDYANGGDKNKLKRKHPAVFPDKIPFDLIHVFCPFEGTVMDPMCGSGSTLVQSYKLGRTFIGIDIEKEYVDLTKERLATECVGVSYTEEIIE